MLIASINLIVFLEEILSLNMTKSGYPSLLDFYSKESKLSSEVSDAEKQRLVKDGELKFLNNWNIIEVLSLTQKADNKFCFCFMFGVSQKRLIIIRHNLVLNDVLCTA